MTHSLTSKKRVCFDFIIRIYSLLYLPLRKPLSHFRYYINLNSNAKKDKNTNNDLQNTTQKTKDRKTRNAHTKKPDVSIIIFELMASYLLENVLSAINGLLHIITLYSLKHSLK